MTRTTREDIATLLANFEHYVNPAGVHDPWFTLEEINQQFAWKDIGNRRLTRWLNQLVKQDKAATEIQDRERVWRWQS